VPPTDGITLLTARYGFKDRTNVPAALQLAATQELIDPSIDLDDASYFLSQITIARTDAPGMSTWRKKLFLAMAHNAANPVEYFALPHNRTVTMGARIDV
jgi:KUP system potassium uptake protein